MAQPVWKARTSKEPDPLVIALCAGRDTTATPPADAALLEHDIHLNRAHAMMLARCKIIDRQALKRLIKALNRLDRQVAKGEITLDPQAEDVHINVEQAVGQLAGEDASGRLHTARSRNDQAATDMRLWLRGKLIASVEQLIPLIQSLTKRAKADATAVCPGFTHMQPAQVMSLGHLWAAHADALTRDVEALLGCWSSVNRCPLGSAASFGSAWPIDREWVASALGFDGPTTNSLDSIANRWEPETRVAQAWATALTHLSTLAADVIWMSTPPRQWMRLDDAHVTGSSIMPQKRNPDLAEVTRARAASCQSRAQAIIATATGQLSGYNRDLQWTKSHVMEAWWEFDLVPEAWRRVVEGITIDRKAMLAACSVGFMEAAEVADALASMSGLPFRKFHTVVAQAVEACDAQGVLSLEAVNTALAANGVKFRLKDKDWTALSDPAKRLAQRDHIGSPAPDHVRENADGILATLAVSKKSLRVITSRLAAARKRLDQAAKRALA